MAVDGRGADLPRARVFVWAVAGFCALLIGVGIGRFAYTPLLPAHVTAGWLTPVEAAFVGSANLAGYLVGALAMLFLAARVPALATVRGAMAVTAISFAACAIPLGVPWMVFWRFSAGVTGALLMIVATPLVLSATPPAYRARVAGTVFTGVGLGVMLSGTFVAGLADAGPRVAWLVLAGVALALAALAWTLLPRSDTQRMIPVGEGSAGGKQARGRVGLLVAAYGCDGIGFLPHSLFLSDFVARGLGQGVVAGAQAWVWFGVGAASGSVLAGLVAGRTTFRVAFVGALVLKAGFIALPLATHSGWAIAASALVVGILTPGMGALASGVAGEVAGPAGYAAGWRWMTTGFALAQAVGAYGFSLLFGATGNYALMFALGAGMLALGGVLAALAIRPDR
jgi:predicted MFS family arabinose efflux permease